MFTLRLYLYDSALARLWCRIRDGWQELRELQQECRGFLKWLEDPFE